MSRYLIISFDANGFICKVHGADGSADIKVTLLGVSRHLNTDCETRGMACHAQNLETPTSNC